MGKKAISFIPNLDMCEYDPSTFAVIGLKSGHNMQEVFEEINNLTVAWEDGEETRLANKKLVEGDEFDLEDVGDDMEKDSGTNKRFFGFFAFYLFGPTRRGSLYNSLWRRSKDAINVDPIATDGTEQVSTKHGKSNAKKKRQAAEMEDERKLRKEGDAKYCDFRMTFEVATVAQTKDELLAQRFDSEMARLSKLIDTETATSELKMRRQDRCTDPAWVAQYEKEIDEHFCSIEKYRAELANLKHSTQTSQKHVDELLGHNNGKESKEQSEIDD